MLLFKKSLKTVLFLAVLIICSSNVGAQNEDVKTGLTKFQLVSWYTNERYLCQSPPGYGPIAVNDTSKANVFYIDTIGKGRYIMALDYEEKEGYSKGRFLFNTCTACYDQPLPDKVMENCFSNGGYASANFVMTLEAIRIDDMLYTSADMPISMSVLNEMVQAGNIQKIDLRKTNNFIFLFAPSDEYLDLIPEEAISIGSEIGGGIMADNSGSPVRIAISSFTGPSSFIPKSVEEDDPTNNEYLTSENAMAFAANGILTIQSLVTENIIVYNTNGTLCFQAQKNAGTETYDISALPQGLYFVKGSSGWAKKVLK